MNEWNEIDNFTNALKIIKLIQKCYGKRKKNWKFKMFAGRLKLPKSILKCDRN